MTPVIEPSIPAVLAERARQQPDDIAYTFIDYEVDPEGFTESLTWYQVHQRARVVAEELLRCGSAGDRAVILAPQSLDYIVAFLGAIQAGFIAVPLSVPQFGTYDERVSAAQRDCSPVAVLTTSAVVDDIRKFAQAQPSQRAPRVIEIDALDFDSPRTLDANVGPLPKSAYLQYTSGSTRQPAGVVVTHMNVIANLEQLMADYFEDYGKVPPQDTTIVSWLPFYHDMGLIVGVFIPMVAGRPAVLMSPVSFMQKPARWMQLLGANTSTFTAAPNFAFELAVRRTSDEDMAGLDLGGVVTMINGAERIHGATVRRFNERFAQFNLPDTAMRPSFGMAEATVYVVSSVGGRPPVTVRFDYEKLAAGLAKRCENEGGSELVSCGPPRSTTVRIVDPETGIENPAGKAGEIWLHGDHVAMGYWRNPQQTERTFGGRLVDPSPDTPQGPWLRTGDLGVMSEGELFIIGRIKDLLIVDGRNIYPDDIEATIQEITGGRVAAISIPDDHGEQLVAIVELKTRDGYDEEALDRLRTVKRQVTSAISKSHSLLVADLVLVPPGSIPITTSGKVRRFACAERYRLDEFSRLEVPA
ncbi:MAG: long-chain fatty acid adenylase/transferase FadD26 [Mycobacterium sp.]|nr:long-chain fatty acid adenylase/transferase FadD26 [Mycobacterium sp.]MDT5300023.1 long-chain fatty acid adenylase/transferase FadD26 [Mycobacterium sp.]